MTTARKGSGNAKGKVKRPAVSQEEAARRIEAAEHTGAAWAAAIGARVRELANELGRLDFVLGHPDHKSAAWVLSTIVDAGTVCSLINMINEAEGLLPRLLKSETFDFVPDFVGACREAADGLRQSVPAGGA